MLITIRGSTSICASRFLIAPMPKVSAAMTQVQSGPKKSLQPMSYLTEPKLFLSVTVQLSGTAAATTSRRPSSLRAHAPQSIRVRAFTKSLKVIALVKKLANKKSSIYSVLVDQKCWPLPNTPIICVKLPLATKSPGFITAISTTPMCVPSNVSSADSLKDRCH